MINKLALTNVAISNQQMNTNGLYSYVQANCQCTVTDKGFRIYRPPNKTQANDGNTMWGGLILKPFNLDSNFLVKNHTYLFLCHIEGQSSNAFSDCLTINNNAGWSGGGLTAEFSNIKRNTIPANFQGSFDFFYRFTVTGDIMKVCTTSYSSFVAGQTYNCYRDWKLGFGYTSTGELGTDLYITNLRLYDITDGIDSFKISKQGIILTNEISEGNTLAQINNGQEIVCNEIYEI